MRDNVIHFAKRVVMMNILRVFNFLTRLVGVQFLMLIENVDLGIRGGGVSTACRESGSSLRSRSRAVNRESLATNPGQSLNQPVMIA